jgi:hypothetical protein
MSARSTAMTAAVTTIVIAIVVCSSHSTKNGRNASIQRRRPRCAARNRSAKAMAPQQIRVTARMETSPAPRDPSDRLVRPDLGRRIVEVPEAEAQGAGHAPRRSRRRDDDQDEAAAHERRSRRAGEPDNEQRPVISSPRRYSRPDAIGCRHHSTIAAVSASASTTRPMLRRNRPGAGPPSRCPTWTCTPLMPWRRRSAHESVRYNADATPATRQYTANGTRVRVSKYFIRKRTER